MDLQQYQDECQNTKSNQFFGERVTRLFFQNAILEAVEALTRLDAIKKSLFYGKSSTRYPVNGLHATDDKGEVETCEELNVLVIGENNDVLPPQARIDLIHAIVGKATEASELLEALYTAAFNGQPLDRVNVIEEIGDGFWYDGIALEALRSSFFDAAARNNRKLKLRFPNKFTTADAIDRNTNAERELLEMPAFERETAAGMLQRLGTDADKWAREFLAVIYEPGKTVDVDVMRAWFANSIEAARIDEQKIWLDAEAKAKGNKLDELDERADLNERDAKSDEIREQNAG